MGKAPKGGGPEELKAVLDDAQTRFTVDAYDQGYYVFPQVWSNGGLGFPGMATASYATAYTYVVFPDQYAAEWLVYFNGRFAYTMERSEALECIKKFRCPSVMDYKKS